MSNQRNIGHFKKLTHHKENTEGLKEAYKNRDTYLYFKDDIMTYSCIVGTLIKYGFQQNEY